MEPIFTFALLADIQYADKDDGNFEARAQRFRQVPEKLAAAVDAMLSEHGTLQARGAAAEPATNGAAANGDATNGAAANSGAANGGGGGGGGGAGDGGLAALVHLGDIIDGYGAADPDNRPKSEHDLAMVTSQLGRLAAAGVPLRHVLGNHCFAVPRRELLPRLGFPKGSTGYYSSPLGPGWRLIVLDTTDVSLFGHDQGSTGYYSLPLGPGWRLVVLDTTDVSLFGHDQGSPEAAEAAAWLAAHPLSDHPNAQTWNGAAGSKQMGWLRSEIAAAAAAGERVIAAGHHPLAEGAAPHHYLAWNHAEIRAAFEERPGVVALALAGHYHPGGATQVNGIHYVTLEGLLEAPPGSNAFAFVDVFSDRLAIRGRGCAASRDLALPATAPAGAR